MDQFDLWGCPVVSVSPGASRFASPVACPPVFSSAARVAVVGSRSWPLSGPQAALVRSFVSGLPRGSVVLSGGAAGADALASSAALRAGLSVVSFPAPWSLVSSSAGPRRSAALLRSVGSVGCACSACAPVVCSVPPRSWLSLRGGAVFSCPGPVACPLCLPVVPVVPVAACVVFSPLGAGSPGSVAAVAAARAAGVPCWVCSPAGVWSRG